MTATNIIQPLGSIIYVTYIWINYFVICVTEYNYNNNLLRIQRNNNDNLAAYTKLTNNSKHLVYT